MSLRERLRDGPPLLLDGGLGSMLIARGLRPGQPPEAWNQERPEEVVAVHAAYVAAGSEAVHTNTFGGNRLRLERFGLGERLRELNAEAVALARRAGARFVIGDVGPSGEYLPPVGHADPDAWTRAFREQGQALAGAGVDALHVETMSDVREALAAVRALRDVAPHTPLLASLTFERRKRGFFTAMGDPLGPSLAELAEAGAEVVGANCTLTSADMQVLAREAGAFGLPLVVQPNAGQPQPRPDGTLAYDQPPEAFAADLAPLWPRLRAVGGCCGTDPRFIAALAARVGAAR